MQVGGFAVLGEQVSLRGPNEDIQSWDSKTPVDNTISDKPPSPREETDDSVLEG